MMTGIISVFLAVLPMGIAFAGGTPLQGSLGWGLSVINGGKSDTEDVYLLILTLTVLMDGILYLIFMHRLFTIPRNVLSIILTGLIVGSMLHQGMIKMPGFGSDYVSNGALTCLSNIIKENEDKTWTSVSANDETQMGLDHGWHYETITFLRNMEYMNKDTKGKMDSDVPDVLLGTGI